jgi:YD repeat-containing protein
MVIVSASCGGGESTRPKVSEIRSTVTDQSGVSDSRTEFVYKNGKLIRLDFSRDSSAVAKLDLAYKGDHLASVAYTALGPDASYSDSMALTYSAKKLTGASVTRSAPDFSATAEGTISYDGDRLAKIAWTEISISGSDSSTISRSTEITYDAKGRPAQIVDLDGSDTVLDTLEYVNDDRVSQITEQLSDFSATLDLSYDDNGHMTKMERSDGFAAEISYDGEGRMKQISSNQGDDSSLKTSYSYHDGEMDEVAPVPDLPMSSLFRLDGKRTASIDVLTTDFLLTY